MKPTDDENFCRVFELPEDYPRGFCFGGGIPVEMKMVDWFQPWPTGMLGAKEPQTWREVSQMLGPWLLKKPYVKPGRRYILLTDFDEAMFFGKGASSPPREHDADRDGEHDVCEGMYGDKCDDVLALCEALRAVLILAGENEEVRKIVEEAIQEHGRS